MPTAMTPNLFAQLEERMTKGASEPAAFKVRLTERADFFRSNTPRSCPGDATEFGVRTGTPFSSYLLAFRVVVASAIENGGSLAP